MSRVVYDSTHYHEAKSKLPWPDGTHCIICGAEFDKPDGRRKYCSQKCYNEWYESLHVRDWSAVRSAVIKRDGRCGDCGAERVPFEVHHIVRIADGGDEFDMDNCVTLCSRCHKKKHDHIGNKIRKNKSLEGYI